MIDTHQITLSHDEALVLFEFFSRFQDTDQLVPRNNAEYLGICRIAAQLEDALSEPFRADYDVLLKQAQSRVAGGYEGLGPGVVPQKA